MWLIPSEFMNVNYGQAVKRYLTERVRLLRVHRFTPVEVQFADALVSSVVVAFEKRAPLPKDSVTFTLGGTLLQPNVRQELSVGMLRKTRKWTNYPHDNHTDALASDCSLTLGDLFTIKRGLATGANDFFIINREDAARHGIPAAFTKPILPSPRRLSAQIVEAGRDGYPQIEPALCLIDCDLPESCLRQKYADFWKYLDSGRQRLVHRGYLASRRSPWYSQEHREAAPFLCTYMGRTGKGRKPFRFVWNKSAAVASNLYLLLYPREPLATALACGPRLYAAVFAALQEIDADAFIQEGRVYGGGLYKMEPKELARLPAASVLAAVPGLAIPQSASLFCDW